MITTPTWFCRPAARQWRHPAPGTAAAPAFHAELPGYRPTALTELPALAKELGVGRVFVKDESTRMGLGAFKVLGASWAIARLLTDTGDADRVSLDELRRAAAAHPVELVTATDGNHGRAVAWMARLLGLEARVFVPVVVSERARATIAAEGAAVIEAGGSYDEAVEQAAAYAGQQGTGTSRRAAGTAGQGQPGAGTEGRAAGTAGAEGRAPGTAGAEGRAPGTARTEGRAAGTAGQGRPAVAVGRLLVQDTAWAGYESVPRWIVEGYGTLLAEVDQQFAERELTGPDLVSVPVGVGSLAQTVVTHYRRGERVPCEADGVSGAMGLAGKRDSHAPAVLAVEPETAAGVLASLHSAARQSVPTAGTVMAGLNCGTPSSLAWPVLAGGLDAAIAVPDHLAIEAGADLGRLGVRSGPSGAASLAGVRSALTGPGAGTRRAGLGVTTSSVVLLLSTEGTGGI